MQTHLTKGVFKVKSISAKPSIEFMKIIKIVHRQNDNISIKLASLHLMAADLCDESTLLFSGHSISASAKLNLSEESE